MRLWTRTIVTQPSKRLMIYFRHRRADFVEDKDQVLGFTGDWNSYASPRHRCSYEQR